jgi:hypothetical protein
VGNCKRTRGRLTGWTLLLGALALPAPALDEAPQDPVAVIEAEFDAARKASSLGIPACLDWIERLYAIADADPGGDQGYEALQLVLEIRDKRKSAELERAAEGAFERMLAHHVDELERIGPLVAASDDEAFVARVLEATGDPGVKATCLYREVAATIRSGYSDAIPDERAEAALARARRIRDEFGEAKSLSGSPFAEVVEGDIFQLEHPRIGMLAPDIEGEDLDGAAFKLSDYRGKVVVLDFWGNW